MKLSHLFSGKPKTQQVDSVSTPCPSFLVESFGLSDPGLQRHSNEDCFVVAELTRTLQIHHGNILQDTAPLSCHRAHVFLVADGVGGHRAGEVASELSVTSVEEYLLNTLKRFRHLQTGEEQDVLRELQSALYQADARIFEETTTHPEWRGMATTLTLAFAVNWRLFVAHAGDSRCYLHSGKKLQQITQDHTVIAELVRQGVLSPQDQEANPWRHVVTNVLGGKEPGVRVDLHSLELSVGDVLLLCSDGLTEMVPEDQIAAILEEEPGPRRTCERLVEEANSRGGKDNVTVIVAHVKQGGP